MVLGQNKLKTIVSTVDLLKISQKMKEFHRFHLDLIRSKPNMGFIKM